MKRLTLIQRNSFSAWQISLVTALGLTTVMAIALPAYAHHPLGGRVPANALEGFLSGLGHPVIGFDHLLFVIAAGLVGSLIGRGIVVPLAFILASLAGTGLHLLALDLPAPEMMISGSVLLFGVILAQGKRFNVLLVSVLGAIAGIFHGYAYGEAIIGAEMAPLFAYLLGFTSIQLAISIAAWKVGTSLLQRNATQGLLNLRFIGCAVCGAGAVFLSGTILG